MSGLIPPSQQARVAKLIAAGGFDPGGLSQQAQAILPWLGGWGPDTVDALVELLEAARAAGALVERDAHDAITGPAHDATSTRHTERVWGEVVWRGPARELTVGSTSVEFAGAVRPDDDVLVTRPREAPEARA